MTTTDTRQQPPFGVGAVVSETLAIFARRFGLLFLLAFVPLAILYGVIFAMMPGFAAEQPAYSMTYGTVVLAILVVVILLLGYSVLASLIILAAFDAKLERPVRLSAYTERVILSILPIGVLSFVVVLLAVLATVVPLVVLPLLADGALPLVLVMVASFVPGFYVWTMFSALIPAILIEGAGFKALGRSMAMTAGYRWPVFAALLIFMVAGSLLSGIARVIMPLLLGIGGLWVWLLVTAAINAVGSAPIAVSVAVTYACPPARHQGGRAR